VSAVSLLDSTGAATIEGFVRKANQRGAAVYIAGGTRAVRRTLLVRGIRRPRVRFIQEVKDAIAITRKRADSPQVFAATQNDRSYPAAD
jgi:SulP family sulfate permease